MRFYKIIVQFCKMLLMYFFVGLVYIYGFVQVVHKVAESIAPSTSDHLNQLPDAKCANL